MHAAASTIHLPAAGTYRISTGASTVRFTTRHMFGLGAVKGTFALASGEVSVAEPLTASQVTAVALAGSFDSGSAMRDNKVKSKAFLDASTYPTISFRSTSLSQRDGQWTLRGELTVRDRTSPIELAITEVDGDDSTLILHASAQVDRYAHGVSKMKGMAARHLTLDIAVTATRV
jgi:polyisoprenoid-binding protein YceI